jgi:LysR family glycine cleavage system transcriptional activator
VIDRKWLPLNALRAFEAVGRRLSFTGGAQALHVSQSALSRHVISLEQLLGKRLIDRRGHGIALTEAGAKLLPVLEKSFDRIEKVLDEIRSEERVGRVLKVHMPPTFLQRVGMQMLHEFRGEYPNVAIDVSSAYGNGLPAREVDVAVVYDKPTVSDDILDLLWMERVTPVCSPALAARFAGRPLGDLLAASEFLHVRVEGQAPSHLWSQFGRVAGVAVDPSRGITFDTLALAVQYAKRGHGVVLADIDLFADEMNDGSLGVPCPDIEYKDGYGYFLSLHPEDLDDPLIALFRTWVISRVAGVDRSFASATLGEVAEARRGSGSGVAPIGSG